MKVKDVMTKNPVTISSDKTVEEAWRYINKLHVWTLPVIDNDNLVGVITKSDLKRRSKSPKQKISKIMSKTPFKVSPDEDAYKTLGRLKRARVNAFMVVEDKKLIGIITQFDMQKMRGRVKKLRCKYCDSLFSEPNEKCPNCGAPIK
jgi:CBS domain-containing protein